MLSLPTNHIFVNNPPLRSGELTNSIYQKIVPSAIAGGPSKAYLFVPCSAGIICSIGKDME